MSNAAHLSRLLYGRSRIGRRLEKDFPEYSWPHDIVQQMKIPRLRLYKRHPEERQPSGLESSVRAGKSGERGK